MWQNACAHAGVLNCCFTICDEQEHEVAEGIIMKIGGWRTRSALERYAIVSRSDRNDAILKVARIGEPSGAGKRMHAEEQQEQIRVQIGHNEAILGKPHASRAVN